jgi:hemolysin D
VITSEETKTIKSVDTAKVRAIHVTEGQKVRAGDTLLELDATPLLAERDKATGDEADARLQVARARAMLAAIDSGRPPRLIPVPAVPDAQLRDTQRHLEGQYADFVAKLAAADAEVRQYTQALPPALERETIYASLLQQNDVSRDAWLEKQQGRIDIESRLADARADRESLVAKTRRDVLDEIVDGETRAANARQDAVHASAQAEWFSLQSPVNGTVQQLSVHTVGGVVQAAEPLLRVVPETAQVEIDASLDNKDVGFVSVGQQANVKTDAFDYTKYGTVPGHVLFISRDAVEGKDGALLYTVRVLLDRSTIVVDGRAVTLTPGMAVNVDIKTGRRRIMEYVLSPLLRHEHESFHER